MYNNQTPRYAFDWGNIIDKGTDFMSNVDWDTTSDMMNSGMQLYQGAQNVSNANRGNRGNRGNNNRGGKGLQGGVGNLLQRILDPAGIFGGEGLLLKPLLKNLLGSGGNNESQGNNNYYPPQTYHYQDPRGWSNPAPYYGPHGPTSHNTLSSLGMQRPRGAYGGQMPRHGFGDAIKRNWNTVKGNAQQLGNSAQQASGWLNNQAQTAGSGIGNAIQNTQQTFQNSGIPQGWQSGMQGMQNDMQQGMQNIGNKGRQFGNYMGEQANNRANNLGYKGQQFGNWLGEQAGGHAPGTPIGAPQGQPTPTPTPQPQGGGQQAGGFGQGFGQGLQNLSNAIPGPHQALTGGDNTLLNSIPGPHQALTGGTSPGMSLMNNGQLPNLQQGAMIGMGVPPSIAMQMGQGQQGQQPTPEAQPTTTPEAGGQGTDWDAYWTSYHQNNPYAYTGQSPMANQGYQGGGWNQYNQGGGGYPQQNYNMSYYKHGGRIESKKKT